MVENYEKKVDSKFQKKNQFIVKRPNVPKHRGKSVISLGQKYNNIGANV